MKTIEVNQYLMDIEHHACFERSYKYSRNYIGKTSDFQEVEISKCHKIIGHNPDDYVQVHLLIEEMRTKIPLNSKK